MDEMRTLAEEADEMAAWAIKTARDLDTFPPEGVTGEMLLSTLASIAGTQHVILTQISRLAAALARGAPVGEGAAGQKAGIGSPA